ncbi:MAG: PQQ-binding-like beta-propeller repeat protein [Planctomycetaceae bacterium]
MPSLELQYADGRVTTCELSRTQPLTIGKQSFNDICVAGDDVGAMHCRVLWNKSTFEVTAATSNGVEVNGTTVAHARLNPGDVIRVGNVDLVYIDPDAEPEPEIRLREIPETPPPLPKHPASTKQNRDTSSSHGRDKREPVEQPQPEASLFEGPVYTESQVMAAYDVIASVEEDSLSPIKLKPLPSSRTEDSPPSKKLDRYAGMGMSMGSPVRPGEQDALRSPLVLGLSLGGMVLVLITGIFWFLISREQSTRLYDRAVTELNDGQYAQSIASFEQFLQQYSGHALQRQAERGLGKALVQKEIAGGTPAWKKGLEQVHSLISRHRNESDFADLTSVLHRYGEEIALGAARTAAATRDPDLLTVSEDAQVILERYSDPASPPTAALNRIKEARVAAVLAIGKQKIFDDSMAAIDAAIAANKPMVALSEREKLVRVYEGFASVSRVKESLQKAIDLERSVIKTSDEERAAETTDKPMTGSPPALGIFHTRTRTDETSLGRVAYVVSKDCCYAVDTVTGELAWRRAIGFDAPFFPVTASGTQAVVLFYDGYQKSLICCQPLTGKLIWRQTLDGRPRSAPLIHEGQIYLPTDDRALCRIDLETGRLTERMTFSQNVQGPPVLSADGIHLLVPGDMAMIYTLSMRPLKSAATTFTDHAAGSIVAPPLALGKLYLLCENDRTDSARLRLWNAANPKLPLVELSAKELRVRGQVREAPVLRGNQLMIPSSGEHLAAFSVTDTAGREGLTPVAQYRVSEDEDINQRQAAKSDKKENPKGDDPPEGVDNLLPVAVAARAPMYLVLGPDGRFWGASSAFRRFELGADSIHMDGNAVAVGIASQKLQQIGDQFFVGRKAPFHDAVVFSSVDRDRMVSPWRIVLGAQFQEVVASKDGGAIAISEAGHVVTLGADRLRQGGFDLKSAVELPLPARINQRLVTANLHDGRVFLAANGDQNLVWIIGTAGQLELSTRLGKGESVQAAGALIDEGLIVPLPGKLKLIPTGANKKTVQDWLAPAGEKPSAPWKHMIRLDSDEVLACTSDGLLLRIQLRVTDVPHLAESARLQLEKPVDVTPAVQGDFLLAASASGLVQLLNWRTFDQDGKRDFAAPVRGTWVAGSNWLVWGGDGKLHSVSSGRDLPIQWSLDLNGVELVGRPLQEGDQIWLAARDGTVIVADVMGKEIRRIQVPQALSMGVKKIGDGLFAVASDGAFYRVDE